MTIKIHYKDTLFKQANLTPIRGEPTLKMLHKLQNEIKVNAKSVYYNLGRGAHVHLSIVLTDTECTIISPTPFVYLTHPGLLVILDGTTAHLKSNLHIAHTERVHLFQEVTGVEEALGQKIVATVKEAYLTDIRNHTTNSINSTFEDMLTHLQEK